MNSLFSASPIWLARGLAIVRITVGALLIYHGQEVFSPALMKEYQKWDVFSAQSVMPYVGKSSELIAGILLLLGFCTRVSSMIVMGTFCFITFFIGHGRFWYEDQHPFMFFLFGLLFLFTGPGAWSVDAVVFDQRVRGEGER